MATTRDILDAIHQHRGDEAPVFDTILENALRLCAADMAVVNTANEAWTEVGYAAGIHSAGPEFQPGRNSWPIESPQFLCRAIFENRTFHTPDLMDTDLYRSGDVTRRNLVDNEGMRTQLVLPLVQGDRAIASFSLYRQKMQPFSDTEISLLETFADQAVIAIENVHQCREVKERLEREAASAEILQVISQSRDDDQPVFDTILRNAARLCQLPDASPALVQPGGETFKVTAVWGAAESRSTWATNGYSTSPMLCRSPSGNAKPCRSRICRRLTFTSLGMMSSCVSLKRKACCPGCQRRLSRTARRLARSCSAARRRAVFPKLRSR